MYCKPDISETWTLPWGKQICNIVLPFGKSSRISLAFGKFCNTFIPKGSNLSLKLSAGGEKFKISDFNFLITIALEVNKSFKSHQNLKSNMIHYLTVCGDYLLTRTVPASARQSSVSQKGSVARRLSAQKAFSLLSRDTLHVTCSTTSKSYRVSSCNAHYIYLMNCSLK